MKFMKTMKTMVTGKLDSFSKYSIFAALVLFLIFLIAYKDVLSTAVLAIVFHIYLRLSHFIFDVIEKVSGEVEKGVK